MTKEKLKSGMLVETRSGDGYMVVLDTGMDNTDITSNNVLLGIKRDGTIGSYGWMDLDSYMDDLTYHDEYYDICAVYFPLAVCDIGNFKSYKELWRRELN